MATVPYSQWLPYVQVNASGCPRSLIAEAVRQKAIEFCTKSRFWRKELDGFYTVVSDSEYEITTPVDSTISDLLVVKVNGKTLEPKTQDELESSYGSEWRDSTGEPKFFFMKDMATVILVPCPDAVYPVRILAALKPTQVAQGIDEIIFEEYKSVITHGALAYLQQMPEKTWSNPNMSIFYQGLFDSDVLEAKLKAEKGYALRKTFRTKAHYF